MENLGQNYGSNPLAVRNTNHYRFEYIRELAAHWDELIDWQARANGEGRFFIDILRQRGIRKVLDVATGTGFHSVRLLEAGFEVVSVDGSREMLAKACDNARRRGVTLQTIQADWRWLTADVHEKFDAVICLGNSFTHLFSDEERRQALVQFYAALHYGGLLIIDQRNYDAILDNGFASKHAYYYCGKNVKVGPEYVDAGLARFRYEFPDESVFHLNMYPLRKSYVCGLLKEVGFQRVKTYGDFKEFYGLDEPDFFIHLADKEYQ